MGKILKELTLDDFIGRLGTKIPSVEALKDGTYSGSSYTDWGQIPYDVVVYLRDDNGNVSYPQEEPTFFPFSFLSYVENNIPFVKGKRVGDKIQYVLRYKTMCYLFGFIRRCFKDARYYRICKQDGEDAWIEITDSVWKNSEQPFHVDVDGINDAYELAKEKFFSQGINMVSGGFPDTASAIESGITGLCILTEYEEFEKRFKERHYCYLFYTLVDNLIKNQYDLTAIYSKPYTEIPLCLTQECVQINRYHPYVTRWIPNKRYYVNQRVWFDGDDTREAGVYMLTAGGGTFDEYQITKEVYDANSGLTIPSTEAVYFTKEVSGITTYWCRKPYYKGCYDSATHITEFDDENTSHWVRCKEEVTYSLSATTVGNGDSYLFDRRSKKIAYDRNGQSYPFTFVTRDDGGGCVAVQAALPYYFKTIENDGMALWPPFLFNPTTKDLHMLTDDELYNNCLVYHDIKSYCLSGYTFIGFQYMSNAQPDRYSIKYTNNLGYQEIYSFTLSSVTAPFDFPESVYELSDETDFYKYVEMPYDEEMSEWVDEIPDEYYGKVFKYTGNDGVVGHNSGSLYTPTLEQDGSYVKANYIWEEVTYDATGQSVPTPTRNDYLKVFRKENSDNTFTYYICYVEVNYIHVDYSTTYTWDEPTSAFTPDGAVISQLTRLDTDFSGITMENTLLFADDANLYSTNIAEDIQVNIERGTSAAVERHNILGEINTFQDLLDYRNNYFNIEKTL